MCRLVDLFKDILNELDIESSSLSISYFILNLMIIFPSLRPSPLQDLTCYACSTNDLTHSCSIGGSRITAFSTQMCRAGESCLVGHSH